MNQINVRELVKLIIRVSFVIPITILILGCKPNSSWKIWGFWIEGLKRKENWEILRFRELLNCILGVINNIMRIQALITYGPNNNGLSYNTIQL